ncbi:hypothetical protein GCM10018790_62760 [Kitasatospora xanthocidica]|nr:hypothetical protein GCM10018790_62760 [Kitasatospora xanthocidica]
MGQAASLRADSFQSAHEYLGRRLGLFASGAITLVAAATAVHRVLDDGPPTPIVQHDPSAVDTDAGTRRIKMSMHLTSHEDRLSLTLAACAELSQLA